MLRHAIHCPASLVACRVCRTPCRTTCRTTPAAAGGALNNMLPGTLRHAEDAGVPLGREVAPGIELMQQSVWVAERELQLIMPRDIDAILEMYISSGRLDVDPYWARPWPSALAMAEWLLQPEGRRLVAGKRVCDIGAGLGIAGIAAALAGAEQVVMLDREPLALQCALLTAEACGVPLGQDSSSGSQVSADLFDWHDPTGGRRFDIALACDVLYEEGSVQPMAAAVPHLLRSNGAALLLADPTSRTEQHRQQFVELLGRSKQGMRLAMQEHASVVMDGVDVPNDVELLLFEQQMIGSTLQH